MTFQAVPAAGKVGLINFFAGDAAESEQSNQWISGQVVSDGSSMKSVALNQLTALHRARDLIDSEIARLTRLYQAAEQSQR
jgi:hypothetical protein